MSDAAMKCETLQVDKLRKWKESHDRFHLFIEKNQQNNLMFDKSGFELSKFINQGAYGVVHEAIRKSDGKKVAMKFFGYTKVIPDWDFLKDEVDILQAVRSNDMVAQFYGIFFDTEDGILPQKSIRSRLKHHFDQHPEDLYLLRYPVIVMEKLEGGCVVDRICERVGLMQLEKHPRSPEFTEKICRTLFKNFLLALSKLHSENRLLNCDLKPDNIMFVSPDDSNYDIKLIDFGLGLSISRERDLHTPVVDVAGARPRGTLEYTARETLLSARSGCVYSTKTEVWQAGCILYVLLHGLVPFGKHRDAVKKIVSDIPTEKLLILNCSLSPQCKDLILQMLDKNPANRISLKKAREHAWFQADLPDKSLGEEYAKNIRDWTHRNLLRQIFKDRIFVSYEQMKQAFGILHKHASSSDLRVITRDQFRDLQQSFMRYTTLPSPPEPPIIAGGAIRSSLQRSDATTRTKQLRQVAAGAARTGTKAAETEAEAEAATATIDVANALSREVEWDVYSKVVTDAGFPWLADQDMFNILDNNINGKVDYFEFMMALTPFREKYDPQQLGDYYFDIFDVKHTNQITKDDFECALRLFVLDSEAYSNACGTVVVAARDSLAATGPGKHAVIACIGIDKGKKRDRVSSSSEGESLLFTDIAATVTSESTVTADVNGFPHVIQSTTDTKATRPKKLMRYTSPTDYTALGLNPSNLTFDSVFQHIDQNHDGFISREEFMFFFDNILTNASDFRKRSTALFDSTHERHTGDCV